MEQRCVGGPVGDRGSKSVRSGENNAALGYGKEHRRSGHLHHALFSDSWKAYPEKKKKSCYRCQPNNSFFHKWYLIVIDN